MYIALNKRRENIAEYILYLWQLEDLLRALQFSPEAIYSQLIKARGLDPDKEQELLIWYMDIVSLLREEGKEEQGHLNHTLHLISSLNDLHLQLMKLPAGESYREKFSMLMPELPKLREITAKSETLADKDINDIELCFRALYGAMLLNIKKDTSAAKLVEDVVEVVSPVIAELSSMYHKVEKGEIDLFKE